MGFLCWKESVSRKKSNAAFESLQIAFGGLVTSTLLLGGQTPLAPVCSALQIVRVGLEEVRGRKERLQDLHRKCELLTTYAILQDGVDGSQVDMTPLEDCIGELNALVQTCADRSRCVAYLHMSLLSYGEIVSLERGIDTVVSVMTLAASTRGAIEAEEGTRGLARLVSVNVLRSNSEPQKIYGESLS